MHDTTVGSPVQKWLQNHDRFLPVGQKVPREQRFCLVCGSNTAEDEHLFLFDCPAYCHIRNNFAAIFWGPAPTFLLYMHDLI